MGSTGAVPGAESGGDGGVRGGMVSGFLPNWEKMYILLVQRVLWWNAGDKGRDGTDGAARAEQKNKVCARLRRTHAPLPRRMDTLCSHSSTTVIREIRMTNIELCRAHGWPGGC